jgi:hypothetical protein
MPREPALRGLADSPSGTPREMTDMVPV